MFCFPIELKRLDIDIGVIGWAFDHGSEFLAGSESDHVVRWDKELLAGAWILCGASGHVLSVKDAEASKLETIFLGKLSADLMKGFLKDSSNRGFRQPRFVRETVDEFLFADRRHPDGPSASLKDGTLILADV